MMSLLKIVCCAVTTAAVLGGVSQLSGLSRSAATTVTGSKTLVAKFVPEPTAPPVITQGSGTR
jgi:hypothetical protein